jgi:hypothetical protein
MTGSDVANFAYGKHYEAVEENDVKAADLLLMFANTEYYLCTL